MREASDQEALDRVSASPSHQSSGLVETLVGMQQRRLKSAITATLSHVSQLWTSDVKDN